MWRPFEVQPSVTCSAVSDGCRFFLLVPRRHTGSAAKSNDPPPPAGPGVPRHLAVSRLATGFGRSHAGVRQPPSFRQPRPLRAFVSQKRSSVVRRASRFQPSIAACGEKLPCLVFRLPCAGQRSSDHPDRSQRPDRLCERLGYDAVASPPRLFATRPGRDNKDLKWLGQATAEKEFKAPTRNQLSEKLPLELCRTHVHRVEESADGATSRARMEAR